MKDTEQARIRRHRRIRKKIIGTVERPRLVIHRSLKNLYAQAIDDTTSRTLVSFSTLDHAFQSAKPKKGKVEAAKILGALFGKILKEKGIQKIAFDRGGYLYHGRVKALADALREAGIEF
ncbi:MAG: 50S ribosomal protein L18 [Candidatus Omnitrophica bacterium]|nr:50S ribosomal protein L18 [Candidatus Omnitrophota bacterium]MDD5671521.1 50S ribosomal protein L18 [Candidatus Omnitrophota bacterium]